jgi:hypothetical protein
VKKEREQARGAAEEEEEEYYCISNPIQTPHTTPFPAEFLGFRKSQVASMSRFSHAAGLSAHHEYEDEELFETSSSISSDSEDEYQFADGEGDEAPENRFLQQGASQMQQPVQGLNSDGLYDLSSMVAQLPVK